MPKSMASRRAPNIRAAWALRALLGWAVLATVELVLAADTGQQQATTRTPEVIARYPHDSNAFTQGLLVHDGKLFESTGLRGRSSLRQVDIASGTVERRRQLAPSLFGEGLARIDDRLVQLTWRSGVALVYDLESFERIGEHRYQGEGWGLCFDGELLAMSDGSSRLTFRDPTTFAAVRSVDVRDGNRPVRRINELECVGRHVFANLWQTWQIVKIDKYSGHVEATYDASTLLSEDEKRRLPAGAVLNGIARDPSDGSFLLTGKLWPAVFRVVLK